MPITTRELHGSRLGQTGPNPSRTMLFFLDGSDDSEELLGQLTLDAPAMFGSLYRRSVRLTQQITDTQWIGAAEYAPRDAAGGGETGQGSFTFDTTGGQEHITQGLGDADIYTPAGVSVDPHWRRVGINATADEVAGADIFAATFKFSATIYIDPEDITSTYIGDIYRLTGQTNSAAWSVTIDGVSLQFERGEVLFMGGRGGKRARGDWEIAYDFAANPNVTDKQIGAITVANKRGWQLLWASYMPRKVGEGASALVSRTPNFVAVVDVYKEGDFAKLKLDTLIKA